MPPAPFGLGDPDDVDHHVVANFWARLEEVLDGYPRDRVETAVSRLGIQHMLFDTVTAKTDVGLYGTLDGLNSAEWFPGVCLDFGVARKILDLGIVGYALLSCHDVGSALEIMYRYHSLTSKAYQVQLSASDGQASFQLRVRPTFLEYRRVIAEEFATGMWLVLSELLPASADMRRIRINFDSPSPSYAERFDEVLRCDIRFDQDRTSVAFPAEWLQLAVQSADGTIEQVCRAQCDVLLTTLGTGLQIVDDVWRLLLAVPSNRQLNLAEVAEAMMMSSRTLERRLLAADTSFRSIRNDVRKSMAAQYVTLGSVSGREIAFLLGYSQPSAFYRAFKEWFNMTPAQYRSTTSS